MSVPNEVLFAHVGTDVVTYDDARKQGPDDQILALKERLDHWLIGRIDPLAAKDVTGDSLVDAPLPLVILSCITLETLGSVFFDQSVNEGETRETFQKAAIYTDSKLKGPME